MINLFSRNRDRAATKSIPSAVHNLAMLLSANKKVLLVDDDNLMREVVMKMPEKMACEVTMVNTAGEAKRMVQNPNGDPFSFIIVDVGITNGDGIQLYKWIKENYPSLQTFFLTGYPMEAVEAKIREIGSAPILDKGSNLYRAKFWEDLFSTYFRIGWRRPHLQQ
jgi:CheY-like chemotaxis protein